MGYVCTVVNLFIGYLVNLPRVNVRYMYFTPEVSCFTSLFSGKFSADQGLKCKPNCALKFLLRESKAYMQ